MLTVVLFEGVLDCVIDQVRGTDDDGDCDDVVDPVGVLVDDSTIEKEWVADSDSDSTRLTDWDEDTVMVAEWIRVRDRVEDTDGDFELSGVEFVYDKVRERDAELLLVPVRGEETLGVSE